MSEEDKSLVLKLKYPVKIGTLDEVKILNLRRIKGKDIRSMDLQNINFDSLLVLSEKLTGQTASFFDEMDGSDLIRLTEKVGNLLDASQGTGS